jgi:hypothetical protein
MGRAREERSDAGTVDLMRGLTTVGLGWPPAPEIMYGRRKMTVWLSRPLAGPHGTDAGGAGPSRVSEHAVDRLMRQEGMYGWSGVLTRRAVSAALVISDQQGRRGDQEDVVEREGHVGQPVQ